MKAVISSIQEIFFCLRILPWHLKSKSLSHLKGDRLLIFTDNQYQAFAISGLLLVTSANFFSSFLPLPKSSRIGAATNTEE